MTIVLTSYIADCWRAAGGTRAEIRSAVSGDVVAALARDALDFRAVLEHARTTGGPALRRLNFHQRADMLKRLALYISERKDQLYTLSFETGATRADNAYDIDGGIGTLFVYASKGRRELPADSFLMDGGFEPLSKTGGFGGQHILTPLRGAAVHINAFNFPVWGMLEKLAPAILAGMPVITKPATATAYLAEAAFRMMIESGILPPGAAQMIVGPVGDLFDHLTCQDVVSFTGSASTSELLQRHPAVARHAVRFIAERDSLNCSILGPDAVSGTPEFDLYIREVTREMTVKAGQKCTAIRRILAPRAAVSSVIEALRQRLAAVRIGHPALETTRMGALASLAQRADVRDKIALLGREAEIVHGGPDVVAVDGADPVKGAFIAPVLLHCADGARAEAVHAVEAFGPVATVIGYADAADAVVMANRGGGSLVASLFTNDAETAREIAFGAAPFHGRLLIVDRGSGTESTGHGSPMPQLVHGGPGRAGGGEELGGMRGVQHYMQRTALQGSAARIASLTGTWLKGAPETAKPQHPFRYVFGDLAIGQTFHSEQREVTLADIEHFAEFTGDNFYAHMDAEAVKGHPFFPGRVAHGYLLLAFAAGLFVEPERGPVLANYGLDNLRFLKPVEPGESIKVRLTVKSKQPRHRDYSEVRWDVEITNGAGETAATYELLTMNA